MDRLWDKRSIEISIELIVTLLITYDKVHPNIVYFKILIN